MAMQSRPRNIIVIGAPRSGTSLTTAIFDRKGYYVGPIEEENVRAGDEHNPFGYFEADDVIAQNVGLFRRVGYPEHNTWLEQPISDDQIDAIARLPPSDEDRRFVASYASRQPWAWKDPRLNLTLAYWWQLMDPTTTGVVYAARSETDIFNSFMRMGWYRNEESSRTEALRRIRQHLKAARDAITAHDIPHIAIDYREYLENPQAVAARLSEFCRVDISPEDLNVRADLAHSSGRGRISAWLRRQLDTGALQPLRHLKPLIPSSVLHWLFPEKKYTPPKPPS
jgi:hypothetical protein